MELISEKEYRELIFEKNSKHLDALLEIVSKTHIDLNQPGLLEGNCMYENCTLNLNPNYINKQINLFSLSRDVSSVLEIGVNAGHSLLIFLVANPNSKIYAFDICSHPYTKPSVDYLNKAFDNRITFFEGDSKKTIPLFYEKYKAVGKHIDLFHVDGEHGMGAHQDFLNCYELSKDTNDSVIVWDDVEHHELNHLWGEYTSNHLIQDISDSYLPTNTNWNGQHAIGLVQRTTI